MKIIIVTIYDPKPNYGNRLQNYAVQAVFEKMGASTLTLSSERLSYREMINIATNYIFIKNDRKDKQLYGKRIKSFNKFNKKYINTQKINSLSDIEDADYFVIGSDQVWNAEWYRDDSITKELYLLTFTTPEKKICFRLALELKNYHQNGYRGLRRI